MTNNEPIAIVGYAFRFPGDLDTEYALWQALKDGRDLVTQVPDDRWATEELQHNRRKEPGRSITFSAGVRSRIDEFDAGFFGISPREAAWMDPQQRMLLELAWEALENAGQKPADLAGTNCAVYVGISSLDYGVRAMDDLASISPNYMTGNTLSIAANRLSYVFDLRGPSVSVDTACSSSLVALHHACNSLRSGEASSALVGGVSLLLHPYPFVGFTKASMLSDYGRCRAFDAAGAGYVRGEGGAVLMLKPLAKAKADGDPVHALILASGINADGAQKTGITIPSAEGQQALMRTVLERSGINPADIDYIEAHGTGTAVGDPVETTAIGAVYGQERKDPLPIGSVKTNLGHMEAASGMGGLIKAILAIKHRAIPPTIHCTTLNPKIDFDVLNLNVAREFQPIDKPEAVRVGVNSFGFGGANAHVILQSGEGALDSTPSGDLAKPLPPLFLSARSSQALNQLAAAYADLIEPQPEQNIYDIAYSAITTRDWLPHRLAVTASTKNELVHKLRVIAQGNTTDAGTRETELSESGGVGFVYSGNGSQWHGMGRKLLQESPEFAARFAALDAQMHDAVGFSILEAIRSEDPETIADTTKAQPLLFALQVCITEHLHSVGIKPLAVTGHSVGEVASAWASGALSLQNAIRVIAARSQAQGLTRGSGRMAAAAISADEATALIKTIGAKAELAGINSPNNVTLSGDLNELEKLQKVLEPRGTFFRILDLDYAFHSTHMAPIRETLAASLHGLSGDAASDASYVSTVTGSILAGSELGADYWWNNIRQPVQFEKAVATMAELGCRVFVEIGPNAILQRYIAETLVAQQITGRVLPTLTRQAASAEQLTAAALRVQLLAEPFDPWAYFTTPGKRIRLPNYPWQKERYWHPQTVESQQLIQRRRVHPLLGWPITDADPVWENTLDTSILPWLADHNVGGSIVFPGTAYVEMALAAASEWLGSNQLVHQHLALEGLDILAPMVFEDGHARQLRLTLSPRDGSFDIRSRPRLSEQDWTLHAVGRVIEAGANPATSVLPETLSQPVHRIDAETHYSQTAALGLHYGPSFRGIERVTLAQQDIQIQVCEAVAQDYSQCDAPYRLPPNVLDLAFQSLVDLLQMEDTAGQGNNSGQGTAYLPVSIEKLALYAQTPVRTIRGRLRKQSRRSVLADFELFDASGALVAIATGCRFRAAPLQSQQANELDLWVEQWQLAPRANEAIAPSYQAISQLVLGLTAHAAHRANITERQRWHQEQRPLIEALALATLYEAFQELEALLPELLAQPDPHTQPNQPLLRWAIACLQQEGLLSETNGQWQLAQDAQLPAAQSIWQALIQEAPTALPQILALARIGKNLPAVLRGELSLEDLQAVLAQSTIADNLLDESPAYAGSQWLLQETLTQIAKSLPKNRELRILEISSGSSDLARPLLARLPYDRLSYQLDVPDEATADRLRAQFADNANMAVSTIELGRWQLSGTGNDTSIYDVIILRHALHRASQPRAAIVQTQRMLAQGGLLLLAEQGASWVEDLLNLGQNSLNPASVWQQALQDEGFENIRIAREPEAQDQEGVPYMVLAQKPLATHTQPAAHDALPASWVLLADSDSAATALALAECLTHHHQDVVVQQIEQGANLPADLVYADKVVALLGWGANPQSASTVLGDVLATLQTLGTTGNKQTAPQLSVVTRGDETVCRAFTGLIRVAMNEMPQLGYRIIDLAADLNEAQLIAALETELMAPDATNEVRLRTAGRFAPVLQARTSADFDARAQPEATSPAPDAHARTRLDFTAAGQLRNLAWFPQEAKSLAANDVEIETRAVGLNFRDVMYTMGLLRDEAVENGFAGSSLGLEFSGVVTRVGAEVTDYQPGQPVMGFGSACFASHIVAPANAIAPMPEGWTFDAAATIPTAFFTVYYALKHLANLQPGERVLIHGAAGGVGIAAIQLAQHLGAEIYATAGTEEKRDFVRQLGLQHVYDSRNLDFAEAILADTQGEGVDVVLNSLAGEAIRRNLQVLKPFGRFLELGKRDFFENTAIGLRPFKDNISYFGIDADQLLNGRPDLAARLFGEVMALFHEGVLYPLPLRSFKAHQVTDAFRAMQQSRHIGKIVVSMSETPQLHQTAHKVQPLQLDKHSTWLVTGGVSGFGLVSAQWLASRGAGHLVLISRRGMATPGAEEAIASLQALGTTVQVVACDITDRAALAALVHQVQATQPPIKGVLHAAAHFDDAVIGGLNTDRFNAVLAPKLLGAWNLHEATQALPLEHFILYSSITTAIGNPAQANYVAANAALEGLAQHRYTQGLPATAIGWGPIADAGYLTRNAAVKDSLAQRLGKAPLTAREALDQLDWLLTTKAPHVSVARIDWATLSRHLPSANSPRFVELNRAIQGMAASDADDIQSLIQGKTFAEIQELISARITQKVARILSISPERIEAHKPLHDLGMDSLMAVELALSMEQRFKLQLPAMLLNDAPTVQGLALRISRMLIGDGAEEGSETPTAIDLLLKQHGESLPEGDVKASLNKEALAA